MPQLCAGKNGCRLESERKKSNGSNGAPWKVISEHIYRDEHGAPFLKVRKCLDGDGRKQYPQFHLENGQWVKGKPEGPKDSIRLADADRGAAQSNNLFLRRRKRLRRARKTWFHQHYCERGSACGLGFWSSRNGSGVGPSSWFRMPTSPAVRTQKKSPFQRRRRFRADFPSLS